MNLPHLPAFRWPQWLLVCVFVFFIASCASKQSDSSRFYSKVDEWSGRISLRSTSHPLTAAQQFSASFSLKGSATAGELTLGTPLGTTLAKAQWRPGHAQLTQGGKTRVYADIDELTGALTGEPLPLAALFSWLNGEPHSVNGWVPDLSMWGKGRLSAKRQLTSGEADMRVVLDRPDN